jgi:hypothetical protein
MTAKPEGCVVVEDSHSGVVAARAAPACALWRSRAGSHPPSFSEGRTRSYSRTCEGSQSASISSAAPLGGCEPANALQAQTPAAGALRRAPGEPSCGHPPPRSAERKVATGVIGNPIHLPLTQPESIVASDEQLWIADHQATR